MILVTGATGHFGKSAINFLLEKGVSPQQLSALVRNPDKATELSALGITLKIGDYSDYDSLIKAFEGIQKLLFVSSSDMHDRSVQHINAVKAARKAGVEHIVYTSFQRKNETSSPIQMISQAHLDTEKEINVSGLTFTILQNGLYADGLPMFIGENVLETGIFLPAGYTKAAFTVRKDMAEAAANILVEKGHENKVYRIATNETNSYEDIAMILSELSGRNITYTDAPMELYIETLTKAGVPELYIKLLAGFSEAIKQGEFDFSDNDLEKLLKRKPTTLKDYLNSVYSASDKI